MIHLALFEPQTSDLLPRGLVELDIDPAAERFCVLDRRSMTPLMLAVRPTSGMAKFIVPFEFSTGFNLLALIMDDAGVTSYNVAGVDKLKAEVVDAKTVSIAPD